MVITNHNKTTTLTSRNAIQTHRKQLTQQADAEYTDHTQWELYHCTDIWQLKTTMIITASTLQTHCKPLTQQADATHTDYTKL